MRTKHLASAALLAVFALILSSCGSAGSDAAAQSYLKAIQNLDFKQAAQYITPESAEALAAMEQQLVPLTDEQKTAAEAAKSLPVKVSRVEETARVYYTVGDQGEESLDLVKINGVWKVKVGAVNSPVSVAQAFLTALKNMDFTTAAEYATAESRNMLIMMQSLVGQLTPEQQEEVAKQKEMVLTMGKSEVEGDTAKVFYAAGGEGEQSVDLVKENGVWKVVFNKNS